MINVLSFFGGKRKKKKKKKDEITTCERTGSGRGVKQKEKNIPYYHCDFLHIFLPKKPKTKSKVIIIITKWREEKYEIATTKKKKKALASRSQHYNAQEVTHCRRLDTETHTHMLFCSHFLCVCYLSDTLYVFFFFLSFSKQKSLLLPSNKLLADVLVHNTHTHSPGISLKILIFFSLSLSVSLSFLLLQISLSGKSYTRRSLLVAYTCFTAYNIPVLDNLMPIAGAIINNGQRQNNNNNEKRS